MKMTSSAVTTQQTLRDHYFSFLEHGKVLFFVIDTKGTIEYASEYIDDILHFKPTEVIGRNFYDFAEQKSSSLITNWMDSTIHSDADPFYLENFSLYCVLCYRHYFDGMIMPYTVNSERRFALYLHDVTQRQNEADKLAQINLELDSFIYKASHDLRSPLLSISGLINLTEKMVPSDSLEYVHLMRRSVDRLNIFISQLANYSRNKIIPIEYSLIDFNELLSDVIEGYRFLPKSEKIQFIYHIEGTARVCSDAFRVRVVLNNLVSNAIKYHNASKEAFIKLIVETNKDEFIIRVIDNGSGIMKNHLTQIFDMFKRGTDREEGSGLGLFIVKKALEKLEGSVLVESTIDEGTTFIIKIPNQNKMCTPSATVQHDRAVAIEN